VYGASVCAEKEASGGSFRQIKGFKGMMMSVDGETETRPEFLGQRKLHVGIGIPNVVLLNFVITTM